jgi:hypothetical protein
MDDIPTTLVTVTTATATQHTRETSAGRPLLEQPEVDVPDWPPLLIIFLLCWTLMAWVVALVLYLATFPEKVACLDTMLRKWGMGGHGDRYVIIKSS